MKNRYVGILVNSSLYRGIPSGRTRHEALNFYEAAAKLHGVTPCYFRLQDIEPEQERVYAYVKHTAGYKKRWVTTPKFIHNRALYFNKSARRWIDELVADGKTIFNEWNRYGKLKIHDLLMLDESIRPHLPGSQPASIETVTYMMNHYDSLILKPDSSSIGRGIMKLDRVGNGWHLLFRSKPGSRAIRSIKFVHTLPAVLIRRIKAKPYLVQQRLPLATYQGRPFDLRVSVQRGSVGDWQVTGIAGKVAKKDAFVTNVAQGGTVYPLPKLLEKFPHLNAEQAHEDICSFSLRVAQHLGMHLPHLADIGLDVGLTDQGFPMFIECNGRDLRYSFREGNMPEQWKATYANPIGYARYLMDGGTSPNLEN